MYYLSSYLARHVPASYSNRHFLEFIIYKDYTKNRSYIIANCFQVVKVLFLLLLLL